MNAGAEAEAKKLGVQVDVYAAPSESDVAAQLTLFEDLLNKSYKGIAFAPLSPVNLVQTWGSPCDHGGKWRWKIDFI